MLVSILHGDTATYLVSSTTDRGRQVQANSVLLWQAILHARRAGCAWFDIGGLNAATPKGIAEFKQGLNATPYALAGEWRRYLLPWQMH
jgi:lipid II:glycine glycyltransferase (peptidoglycan interpeptide bridge formation enzyme)